MEGRPHLQPALLGQVPCMAIGLVEVAAVLHQLRPEGAHGGVLLHRIALRHHHGDGQAGAARGEGQALAVIAARRRDDAADLRPPAAQPRR